MRDEVATYQDVTALRGFPVGIALLDASLRVVDAGGDVWDLTPGQGFAGIVHPGDREVLAKMTHVACGAFDIRIAVGGRIHGDITAWRWHTVRYAADQNLIRVVAVDIDESYQEREMLLAAALTDPLTGLANRGALVSAIEDVLDDISPSAVVFIDVDHLKAINDRYGHPVGDSVLRAVGRRLASAVRDTDVAARIGGDEFVVLARSDDAEALKELPARLMEAVCGPYRSGRLQIHVSASAGMAMAEDGDTPHDLLTRADRAMYQAKRRAKRSRRR